MTEPTPTEVKPAICPHCKLDMPHVEWNVQPAAIAGNDVPSLFVVFFCAGCRVALNAQLIPFAMAPQRRPVVIPGDGFRPPR